MKKILKLLGNLVFSILLIVLFFYIVGMQFFPKQIKGALGYQTFVILSDSMESTLPVGSLVLSKNLTDEQVIPINTIVSFRVHWGDKEEIFTHYLKKIEIDETGKERYFTQGEKTEHYDDYVTYREDILGTYVLHIPYIGKFILFLQSPFALIELGIILFISLINRILWNKFDREEKEALTAGEEEEDVVDAEEINEIEADMKSENVPQLSLETHEEAADLTEGNPDILPEDESEPTAAEEVDTQGVKEESIQESMPASIPVEESEVVKVIEVEEALETSAEDTEAAISLPEIIVENPREKQKDKKSDKKQKKDKKKKKKKDKKKSKKKK